MARERKGIGAFAERFALGLEPEIAAGRDDSERPGLAEQVNQFEAQIIRDALTTSHRNARIAMERLKLARKTLYDKLARYQIRIDDYRIKATG